MNQNKKAHILYIDILNILACFGVVVLHSTDEVFSFSASGTWKAAVLLQAFWHFAVPVFFMLSGATLIGYRKRYTTLEFFKRRFLRIGVPFIFWTLFYVVWNRYILSKAPLEGPHELFEVFMQNKASNIFWFFYALIPIYLLMPLLSAVDWQKHRKMLLYILILCFFYNQLLPLWLHFGEIRPSEYAAFPFAGVYVDYALLGLYLKDSKLTKKLISFGFASFLIGFLGMAFATWFVSSVKGQTDMYYMGYHCVFCWLISVGVFILVRYFCDLSFAKKLMSHEKTDRLVSNLSGASFGVYLTHLIFIVLLRPGLKLIHPVLSMTAGAFLVYLVSVTAIMILKKIPVVKNIVP
ncbi:MAG TPA: acyltransferase [Clostridiales bacterium]|nr:acyltransferase [Clostridiales bacterium]HRT81735.1 acyltransferase [Oscillospiraceae bacterium]